MAMLNKKHKGYSRDLFIAKNGTRPLTHFYRGDIRWRTALNMNLVTLPDHTVLSYRKR